MSLSLHGQRVAVIGMARSGIGAAKLIHRLGGRVLISDLKPATALSSAIEELRETGTEIETGAHQRVAGEPFDLIVLSPGVIPAGELQRAWESRGTPVWSELELAARAWEHRWIGVTGSNGKTTTVHLIHDILTTAGMNSAMAGNVGTAWSSLLPAPQDRVFAVEVSSFQLEHSPSLKPAVGVLLNLFENHLDRHGTMEVYAELKSRLLRHQTSNDTAVVNGDDARVMAIAATLRSRVIRFGRNPAFEFWTEENRLMCRWGGRRETLLERRDLPLTGRHNELNALAAAAATLALGVPLDAVREGLRTAKPVEHRIEFVTDLGGVAYYNDSKSTNMVATMTALDSFEQGVILLFGGRPKKESFAPLAERIHRPIKRIVVFGEAIFKLRDELPAGLPVDEAADLSGAVDLARRAAQPGDTVLLSPGCTSFDQFNNYEERGREFKSLVNQP
jgi:UDP-N-acetylmuramoylalanine--D-glutamate ligase